MINKKQIKKLQLVILRKYGKYIFKITELNISEEIPQLARSLAVHTMCLMLLTEYSICGH